MNRAINYPEGIKGLNLKGLQNQIVKVALVASFAIASLVVPAGAAQAAEPAYPVMNTSEYPPDGVYWRSAPDWNSAIRITGHGYYAGDSVRLKCWEYGSNVPRPDGGSNLIWYQADNVTRPGSPVGANSGWMNAHFVNDGTGPNQVAPGVIRCGSTPPPPPPPPPAVTTVYFSPFEAGTYEPANQPVVQNAAFSKWTVSGSRCNTKNAINNVPGTATVLSGWSIGRLGPVYALARMSPAQRSTIKHVFVIDPGTYGDLAGGCDNTAVQTSEGPLTFRRPGWILGEWLSKNPGARLTIMAGNLTAQDRHRSIQNIYFNDIRQWGQGVRNRVSVCNYDRTGHTEMFLQFNQFMNSAPVTSSCPSSAAGVKPTLAWPWHP